MALKTKHSLSKQKVSRKCNKKIDLSPESSQNELHDDLLLRKLFSSYEDLFSDEDGDRNCRHEESKFSGVKFASKSTIVHYIGQIMQQNGPDTMDTDRNGIHINFPRREKQTVETFVFPSVADSSFIKDTDIVFKLPDPILHGGTARVRRHLKFTTNNLH